MSPPPTRLESDAHHGFEKRIAAYARGRFERKNGGFWRAWRELTDNEIDAVSGGEGCRVGSLGEYLLTAIQFIAERIGQVLSRGSTDPWEWDSNRLVPPYPPLAFFSAFQECG